MPPKKDSTKAKAKAADATAAATTNTTTSNNNNNATISIDVEDFIRTRDSVVTGLTTLQDVIRTISSAYIKHTNAILGEHGSISDVAAAIEKLGENPLLRLGDNLQDMAGPAKASTEPPAAADNKKERKKRQHDPDAPKRPLTPFFLYMQTARPIIASDLGPDVAKGAVSTEGTERWSKMDADDKQLWTNAYKDNLRLYNARMHYYKAGNKDAKDMSDNDAVAYAEEHNIGVEAGADAQLVGEAAAVVEEDAEGEPEKEPTPPPAVKTPKAKAARKSKAKSANTVVEEAASDPPAPTPSSIVPPKSAETPKSPDKKRKRVPAKKGAVEEAKADEKEDVVETPAKSASKQPRKKKAKSDS